MADQAEMNLLENIIVQNAGPMGKFVIKKTMADMGIEPHQIAGETQSKFIDTVIERAIFDTDRQAAVRREILSAWSGANV